MKSMMKIVLGLCLVLAVFVHMSEANSLVPAAKECRTDWCGGFAGFACCGGFRCEPAKECCDFPGKCIPIPGESTAQPATAATA